MLGGADVDNNNNINKNDNNDDDDIRNRQPINVHCAGEVDTYTNRQSPVYLLFRASSFRFIYLFKHTAAILGYHRTGLYIGYNTKHLSI